MPVGTGQPILSVQEAVRLHKLFDTSAGLPSGVDTKRG